MIEAVVKGLGEEEKEILVTSLTQLKDFFMNYKKKHKNS